MRPSPERVFEVLSPYEKPAEKKVIVNGFKRFIKSRIILMQKIKEEKITRIKKSLEIPEHLLRLGINFISAGPENRRKIRILMALILTKGVIYKKRIILLKAVV